MIRLWADHHESNNTAHLDADGVETKAASHSVSARGEHDLREQRGGAAARLQART